MLHMVVDNCDMGNLHFINKLLTFPRKPVDFDEQMALNGLEMRPIGELSVEDIIDHLPHEAEAMDALEIGEIHTALAESQNTPAWDWFGAIELDKLTAADGSFVPQFRRRNLGRQRRRQYRHVTAPDGTIELHYVKGSDANSAVAVSCEGQCITAFADWQVLNLDGECILRIGAGTPLILLQVLDGALAVRECSSGATAIVPAHIVIAGSPVVSPWAFSALSNQDAECPAEPALARLERMWGAAGTQWRKLTSPLPFTKWGITGDCELHAAHVRIRPV